MDYKNALCYYCHKNSPDPKHAFRKTLYKKLDSSYGIGLTGLKKTTKFYEKEVEVERCGSCYTEHNSANKPAVIVFSVTAAVAAIITGILARRLWITIGTAVGAGIVAVMVYFQLVYYKRIKALGIKDSEDVEAYPPIKELLDNGWQSHKP